MYKIYIIIIFTTLLFSCTKENKTEFFLNGKSISGYFDKRSYLPGDSALFYYSDCTAKDYFDTPNNSQYNQQYKLKYFIYNINEEIVDSLILYPQCKTQLNNNPWENGFGYDSVKIRIPELASGIYFINKQIPFIVKSKLTTDIAVVYPTNTVNAYNSVGGKNLYRSFLPEDSLKQVENRAHIVSFLRPLEKPVQQYAEAFYKWVIKEPYEMDYLSDEDLENYSIIENKKLLIITGHSEYWTRNARENIDRFVQKGGNLLILSGNTMWWQVRLDKEKSKLICYKKLDLDTISDINLKTVNWNEPYLNYSIISSIGADFSFGGYGNHEKDKGWNGYKIIKPNSPIFKNTSLNYGDIISIPTKEYDGAPLKGFNKLFEPIIDIEKLNFYKIELLAFDLAYRTVPKTGTFIVFQKTPNSGIIINTASTNWCSNTGIGGKDSIIVRKITKNMIELLSVANPLIFSDN